jgi:uncharacterized membrane protein
MNQPENLSPTAKKVYENLSNSQSPKTMEDITNEFASQPTNEEGYKAVSTADSLVAKGIVTVENDGNANTSQSQATYTLVKGPQEVGPSEEADAKEAYAEKTDANDEEKRMMAILEDHGGKMPAAELFDLYLKAQSANSEQAVSTDELTTAIKELTDAGLITKEERGYQVKA